MSAGKEIKDKIRSVSNTKKITNAMEKVAASKMRKAQDRMQHALPYAKKILEVIGHVARSHAEYHHPLMAVRDIRRVGYIIITTDKGLCGGLNAHLLKACVQSIKRYADQGKPASLCLIGGKGQAFFKKQVSGQVLAHRRDLGDAPKLAQLIEPTTVMVDAYRNGQIDALYLCYNNFVSTMRQEPILQPILPLIPSRDKEIAHHWDYIYEPDDAHVLLDRLLTRYIEAQVYRAVTENIASEQAARMMAMRQATDNAAELIGTLQLAYNKARQAAITRELSEIVAGASVI